MRNHFVDELTRLAAEDENIVLLVGDLGYGVVEGFASAYPKRYYNAGISEQNMTAMAAGLAACGFTAYSYSMGNFNSLRAMEHIRNDICSPNFNVKIVSYGAALACGQLGMSHHSTEEIGAMRLLPNMKVFVPSDASEAIATARAANAAAGPCFIRIEKNVSGQEIKEIEDIYRLQLRRPVAGGADAAVPAGKRVCIITAGLILEEALKAGEILDAAVYTMPVIKPAPVADICRCFEDYDIVVTLEEHMRTGGLGSAVLETAADAGCFGKAKLLRIGIDDCYAEPVGSTAYLRKLYGIDADSVVEAVRTAL